jgi:hypothetical protein
MGERRVTYKSLVGKLDGYRSLRIPIACLDLDGRILKCKYCI